MTKCDISIKLGENMYLLCKCMSSGYLDGVGVTLLEHYKNEFDILDLMTAGEFSPLDITADLTKESDLSDQEMKTGYPVALKDINVMEWNYRIGETEFSDSPQEYRYLWKDGAWWCTTWKEPEDATKLATELLPWKLLTEALKDPLYNQFLQ